MTTKLTDEQVNTLWDNFVCPKCGSGDGMDNRDKRYFCLNEDRTLCWEGTSRDLVEAAMRRAGIEIAEPWRSDEPPMTTLNEYTAQAYIEVQRRGCHSQGVKRVVRHRDGEATWYVATTLGSHDEPLRNLGTDWKWRPIGPNPFDQEG